MNVLPEPETLMLDWGGTEGIGSSFFGVNFNLLDTVYYPKPLRALRRLKLKLDNWVATLAAVDAPGNEISDICGRFKAKGGSLFFRMN